MGGEVTSSAAFVSFRGVNTPTLSDFKLPRESLNARTGRDAWSLAAT